MNPLLRISAIAANVVMLGAVVVALSIEGPPKSADGVGVLILLLWTSGPALSLAALFRVRGRDPEEQHLIAEVRKAELRKKLRELEADRPRR